MKKQKKISILITAALCSLAVVGLGWTHPTDMQDEVHAIAEHARSIGLEEDNPIIVECQRIWVEEQESVNTACEDEEMYEEGVRLEQIMTPIGQMYITGYDICYQCCGKVDGITASGTAATVGRTIAAGYQFPFGTQIYIEGLGIYTVEDCGPQGNVIDVLCNNHSECHAITGFYQCYIVEG